MDNNSKDISVEGQVYLLRYQQELERGITLQIELNKVALERDRLKKELEELKQPAE